MPLDVKLNFKLHVNQQMIHDRARTFTSVVAGKRFGKSKLAIYRMLQKAGRLPGGCVWYIAPFFRMAKQIAWHELIRMLPPQLIKRKIETDLFLELWNGCRIMLVGADHEEALRGPKLDHVVLDEAAYIREDVWPAVIRGQLLGPTGSGTADFISSPNKTGKNWYSQFHEDAMKRMIAGDPDWAAFKFTIYDNPTIPASEIKKMEADTPDDVWALEYMAQESDFAGTKYAEFKYEQHVAPFTLKEPLPAYRGGDWGLLHATVFLWAKVDKSTGMVYIYDEFYRSGLIIEEVVRVVKEKTGDTPIEWTVIDPSMNRRDQVTGRSVKDEFLRCGLGCVDGDRRGADNIGGRGVDIVKMFLKKGLLKIDPRCKNLILELRNLQWGQKTNDDATDALRYLLVRLHDLVFNGVLNAPVAENAIWQAPSVFNISMFKQNQPGYSSSIREEINTH